MKLPDAIHVWISTELSKAEQTFRSQDQRIKRLSADFRRGYYHGMLRGAEIALMHERARTRKKRGMK